MHKISKQCHQSKLNDSNELADEQEHIGSSGTGNISASTVADQFNHVSYSFSFFLHGSSRVCTSVDMKLHRPIRLLNTNDLFRLKARMSKLFAAGTSETSNLPASLYSGTAYSNRMFRGIEVILAPHGICANLIGYLSNDSDEAKLTCSEWQQFYALRLNANLPRVFVVGLENNVVKLFYPNSFVYVVINDDVSNSSESEESTYATSQQSSDNENSVSSEASSNKSSDYEDNDKENCFPTKTNRTRRRCNTKKTLNKSSSFMSNASSPVHAKSKHKKCFKSTKSLTHKENEKINKEMDSLELTIDSVARNFGTDLATGTDSSSDNEEIPHNIKQSPSVAPLNAGLQQQQSSPNLTSPSHVPNLNSTKSPSIIMLSSPKGVSVTFIFLILY